MATVRGFTAERMLEIEQSSVVSGAVDSTGELLLERRDGTQIDGGNVMPSLDLLLPAIFEFLYPVGHIYMSVDPTDPGTKFGGTWASWGTGKVPVGVDTGQTEFNTVEKTGGEKTHLLTASESGLVGHNHTQNAHNHTQNAHNHTQDAHNHGTNLHSHSVVSGGTIAGPEGKVWADLAGGGGTTVATASRNFSQAGWANPFYAADVYASNQAATATNQAATATNQAATATNNAVAAANAASAHNNLPPYVTCYMWKRTA